MVSYVVHLYPSEIGKVVRKPACRPHSVAAESVSGRIVSHSVPESMGVTSFGAVFALAQSWELRGIDVSSEIGMASGVS